MSWVENAFALVANASMLAMMALISIGTFSRYVLNSPIVGTSSVVELYMMPLLVFGTAALLQRRRGHINVDLLRRRFGEIPDLIVDTVTNLGIFAVFAPISVLTYQQAMQRISRGAEASVGIQLPTGYSWLIVSLGLALLCVRVLVEVVRNLVKTWSALRNDTAPRTPSEEPE